MGAHVDLHVQVAGRAAVLARLALSGQADPVAGVHPGGDLGGEGLLLAHPPLATALGAGVGDDLAPAAAARTGLLDGEEVVPKTASSSESSTL